MTECEKRAFTVTVHRDSSYILEADPWTSLDTAWASQKCWFTKGMKVTITDDKGNSKTFIKEE